MKTSNSESNSFHALVVDGDAPRREDLTEVLKNCGYTVTEAAEAGEVEKLAQNTSINVILCQDQLTESSGLELLTSLRGNGIETHFILMTDGPDAPDAENVLTYKNTDIFDTPGGYAKLFPKLAVIQAQSQAGVDEDAMAVHPVKLPELTPGTSKNERSNVDLVMDIPISISVILGSTSMLVHELLQLGPGSVVELNKRAGEPIDIYVNDKLLAIGEVVVVNETFGVRISEIINPKQRVQALS